MFRTRRFAWLLLLLVSGVAAAELLTALTMIRRGVDPAAIGLSLFGWVTLGLFGLSVLVLPGYASTSITSEREGKTLDALLAIGYSSYRLAWGKFLASFVPVAVLAVALAPAVALVFLYGGVGPREVLVTAVLYTVLTASIAMFGVGVSASQPSSRRAIVVTYGLLLLAGPALFPVLFQLVVFFLDAVLGVRFLGGFGPPLGLSTWSLWAIGLILPLFLLGALWTTCYLTAVNRLKHPTANRTTNLRLFALAFVGILLALSLVTMRAEFGASAVARTLSARVGWGNAAIGNFTFWCLVIVLGFACESPIPSRRMRRARDRLTGLRGPLRLLHPGYGSGAPFAVLFSAAVLGLVAWGVWSGMGVAGTSIEDWRRAVGEFARGPESLPMTAVAAFAFLFMVAGIGRGLTAAGAAAGLARFGCFLFALLLVVVPLLVLWVRVETVVAGGSGVEGTPWNGMLLSPVVVVRDLWWSPEATPGWSLLSRGVWTTDLFGRTVPGYKVGIGSWLLLGGIGWVAGALLTRRRIRRLERIVEEGTAGVDRPPAAATPAAVGISGTEVETSAAPRPRVRPPPERLQRWIDRANPVWVNELRLLVRSRRFFLAFLGGVAALGLTVWITFFAGSTGGVSPERMGRSIFAYFAWVHGLLLLFAMPAIGATAITEERERNSLDLLATTGMSAGRIVRGKWYNGLGYLAMLMAATFPIVLVSMLFGGVGAGEILLLYLLHGLGGTVLLTVGLFFSALMPRTRWSTLAAYGMLVWVAIGYIGGMAELHDELARGDWIEEIGLSGTGWTGVLVALFLFAGCLAVVGFLLLCAVGSLKRPWEDRSTRMRPFLLVAPIVLTNLLFAIQWVWTREMVARGHGHLVIYDADVPVWVGFCFLLFLMVVAGFETTGRWDHPAARGGGGGKRFRDRFRAVFLVPGSLPGLRFVLLLGVSLLMVHLVWMGVYRESFGIPEEGSWAAQKVQYLVRVWIPIALASAAGAAAWGIALARRGVPPWRARAILLILFVMLFTLPVLALSIFEVGTDVIIDTEVYEWTLLVAALAGSLTGLVLAVFGPTRPVLHAA